MRGDSESRSRYLSLALTSRRAINSLRAVATGDPVGAELGISLQELVAGSGSESQASFVSHIQASGAWTRYEELSTIDEIKQKTGILDLSGVVFAVLNGADESSRKASARKLIAFLTSVEGRALQHYSSATDFQPI